MTRTIITHYYNDIMIRTGDANAEYEQRTPETFPEWITTELLSMTMGRIVWWDDLRLYSESVIKLMYDVGFTDVTAEDLSIHAMPVRSFKYIIDYKGNPYAIYIRMRKATMYIYNMNNLLANIDHKEIFKAWGHGEETLEALSDAMYEGVLALNGFQEKKTPYTLSMVASRKWKKREKLYRCPMLTNCNDYPAPAEGFESLAEYIRDSYQAGWNYAMPISRDHYREKRGVVYDINSSYPYVMATKPIPWGEPAEWKGDIPDNIKNDPKYYYFVRVKIQFDLKKGHHLPYLRKRGDFAYRFQEYMETSDILIEKRGKTKRVSKMVGLDGKLRDVCPEFVLSKTDYELIHRHYDIRSEEVLDGVYYQTANYVFSHFITECYHQKTRCGKAGDAGGKRVAKMIMNSVAGGLAKRPTRTNIVYDEHMNVETVMSRNPSPSYIHMASAILSYAREIVYEAACVNYDTFLYSDTDSLHLLTDKPIDIELDEERLGAWKVEHAFKDAYYYKRKCYTLRLEDDRYYMVMSGVANEYKTLMEDVMGQDRAPIQWLVDLRMDKYGNARHIMRMIKDGSEDIFDMHNPDPEDVWTYTKDKERFDTFVHDVKEAEDKIAILQYIDYPTGIDECKDFEIRHTVEWRHFS